MRITIPTVGSRGDMQPYVALGVALHRAGHDVCLATHRDYEPFVRGHGLDFFAIAPASKDIHSCTAGDRLFHTGDAVLTFIRQYSRMRVPLMRQLMADTWRACAGADLVLTTMTTFMVGYSVAEKRRLPTCLLSLQPTSTSRFEASCLFPPAPHWPLADQVYNLWTHGTVGAYFWKQLASTWNEVRRDVLDLPALNIVQMFWRLLFPPPTLLGYSPLVVPRPPDWGPELEVTGYWFLDDEQDWQPPADLTAFLEAGPSPVYIGFGSMYEQEAASVTRMTEEALARTGQRGILMTGWGGLCRGQCSERFFYLDAVPHSWLFPRVAAVVHHGGAGTTAAGLRAGVPSLLVPYFSDQPFWGRRVADLGVGPPPIPRKQLTADRLAEGIQQAVTDPAIRARAATLGAALRVEDGAGRAVAAIERFFPDLQPVAAPRSPSRTRARELAG